MAPSVHAPTGEAPSAKGVQHDFDAELHKEYPYTAYLPVWNADVDAPAPAPPADFVDKATLADKAKPQLAAALRAARAAGDAAAAITRLTPRVGAEVRGLQLSRLTDGQKNEVALLVAERGVVVFRDQDFKDQGPAAQKAFARYFGPLHVHPVEAQVAGHPELYSIYQGPDSAHRARRAAGRLTATRFHSDVSYEHHPPAYTVLTMLHAPATGGDTAWVSTAAAHDRLSPWLQHALAGLRAVHAGQRQADQAAREGHPVLRPPAVSHHPVVRLHPATGQRMLFVNASNTTRVVGLRDEESDALLGLLVRHLATALDCQVRVRWAPGTVVIWDNRATVHTPIPDFSVADGDGGGDDADTLVDDGIDPKTPAAPVFRHAFRITTVGERPFGVDGLETVW